MRFPSHRRIIILPMLGEPALHAGGSCPSALAQLQLDLPSMNHGGLPIFGVLQAYARFCANSTEIMTLVRRLRDSSQFRN